MKNRSGSVVALLVVGAVVGFGTYYGIDRYYESHRRDSEASAEQFVTGASKQDLIPVEIEVAVPEGTPPDQALFLSGSEPALGNWDAAGVALTRGSDGKHRCKVEVTRGVDYAFKVTRGTWSTVEEGEAGAELPNRSLHCDKPQVMQVQVTAWRDRGKAVPNRITTAGDIRLHKKFQSKILGNERTIVVYLPPGYEHGSDERFAVLYMHDGQNLFDESTSYAGVEWRLDEAAQSLISSGKINPIIIVGIYNTPDRTAEFTPAPAGRADLYGRFIVEELKPFIDSTYRTKPDRANTALGGSSMGGLATIAIASTQSDTFGKVALLTPFLRTGDRPVLTDASKFKGTQIWLDMGPSPAKYYSGPDPIGDAQAVVKVFDGSGLRAGADYHFELIKDGEHSESSWQQRVPAVLQFLFRADNPTTGPS